MINHCTCSTRFHLVLSAPYPDSLGGEEPVAAVRRGLCGRPQWPPGSDACEATMASALATPHTATRPSSLSSSFGLSSSLSFIFMLLFWLFWLFWLVLLGFAFCSAFCSSSIFFRNSACAQAPAAVFHSFAGAPQPLRSRCSPAHQKYSFHPRNILPTKNC